MENQDKMPVSETEAIASVPAETATAPKSSPDKTEGNKKIIIAIAAALILALGILGYYMWKAQLLSPKPLSLTPEAASKTAIDYINKYFAGTGNLASISDLKKEETPGLYKFTLELQGQKLNAYVSSDGKMLFPQEPIDLTKSPEEQGEEPEESSQTETEAEAQNLKTVEGNFNEITGAQICKENNKPIVYFFGSEGCPHCVWEKPIISAVAQKFGTAISYHENVDNNKDMDIFKKYSSGGIPTLVIGCKYYRIGSGQSAGAEAETAALTKLICNVTGNQPAELCGK